MRGIERVRAFPWNHLRGMGRCVRLVLSSDRAPEGAHALHNVPMIPKSLQFLLLLPLAFGPMAPRFFVWIFLLALVGMAIWWLRTVLAMLFGD